MFLFNSSLRIWDLDGNCLNELYSHTAFVYCVKYNPVTDEIISCGEDRTVKIWKGIIDLKKKKFI